MNDDFWLEGKKKSKVKLIVISVLISILVIFAITIVVLYNTNEEIHNWIDKTLLKKEIYQDTSVTIDLEDENSKVYAFNQNIAVLNKNKLTLYNNFGGKEGELNVEITNPIVSSSNRFIAIGENQGKKLYIIEDKKIIWEKEIEGEISQVHINKNGYVAVIITGTSYKTVIDMYDNKGNCLFKKYLSSTRLSDVDISNDNKYMAIAEVDTSGTLIQSNIKIISIEKAQTDSKNSVENTYENSMGSLITNVKYQDNNRLVCMYDDSIHIITNGKDEMVADYKKQKISFCSIELTNNIVDVKEQSSGLFTADSMINITNVKDKNLKTYKINTVAKQIDTYDNIIVLNTGSEIEFINTDAWLIKRYIAKQEITNIVLSNSIAGIVYRDKVEIINL